MLAASSARANALPLRVQHPHHQQLDLVIMLPHQTPDTLVVVLLVQVSTMDKVTYSSDTTAAVPGAALSVASYYVTATGNSTNGYFGGGGAPGNINNG
jgi:hypothetical protein